MYYIIQKNTFNEENYDNLISIINRYSIDYEIVDVWPFIDEVEFITKRKDVFVFGGLKLSRLGKKYGWIPGSLLNSNHDYRVYSKFYTNNLLNYDSKVQKIFEKITDDVFFARPCEDNKIFTGKVYTLEEWNEYINQIQTNGHSTLITTETEIQISSVKEIQKEFRFWIVGDDVVTASQYKIGNWVNYSEIVDDGAYEFCKQMIKLYKPAEAFVMDICLIDDEYKIIEIGCINSCGFYKSNMNKLIESLENYF